MDSTQSHPHRISSTNVSTEFMLDPVRVLDGPLFVTDPASLVHKLAHPAGVLATAWARFKDRLATDIAFRRDNLFLLALLPDTSKDTLEEIAQLVRVLAGDLASTDPQDDRINNHTWCAAPFALRAAAYATWLVHSGHWHTSDLTDIGRQLLGFCEHNAQNVLRTRVPTSDNQSMSMALTCTAVGHAFTTCDPLRQQATRLRDENMTRLITVLRLADEDGYLCEGSTYQSHVVTPLAMWTASLFEQMFGKQILQKNWQPGGASILGILNFESLLWGPGHIQPGWDNHGWEPQTNLAGIASCAKTSHQPQRLQRALDVWDNDTYIAWCQDDRLWTLLNWPDEEVTAHQPKGLGGWAMPHTAAALDNHDQATRLMLCFDRCAEALLSVSRNQTNPNHLLFEIDGSPIFGDGKRCTKTIIGLEPQDIRPWLEPGQIPIMTAQRGSVENWVKNAGEEGMVGAANCIIIDHEETYFNATGSRGQLVFEQRQPDCHLASADARAFYLPRYDLTHATRAIASTPQGPHWIVDHLASATSHAFTFNLYLRLGCTLHEHGLSLTTSDHKKCSMAWLPVETQSLADSPNYPDATPSRCNVWPEHGGQRLQLTNTGSNAQFVVCLVPGVCCDMQLEALGKLKWRVCWQDENGKRCEQIFEMPAAALNAGDLLPTPALTWDDLDDAPATISNEITTDPLAFLKDPKPADWRMTIQAMQAVVLAIRQGRHAHVSESLPWIHGLLVDTRQGYQVHSVAAWSLGAVLYAPAAADLSLRRFSIEPNLMHRACWAYERISNQPGYAVT